MVGEGGMNGAGGGEEELTGWLTCWEVMRRG